MERPRRVETAPIRRGWGSCLRGGGSFMQGGGGVSKRWRVCASNLAPPPRKEGGGGYLVQGGGASLAKQSIHEFVV